VLDSGTAANLQFNLALAVAVLVLLVIANAFPIMTMDLEGQHRSTTVLQGVSALWQGDRAETAILVLAVTIVIPLLRALAVVYLTIPLLRGRSVTRHAGLVRLVTNLTPWGMTEVYLLGALVAFVKLGDIASVEPGPALFAFAVLCVSSALSTTHLDSKVIWAARRSV
jgi:paraquat-inducible protein A